MAAERLGVNIHLRMAPSDVDLLQAYARDGSHDAFNALAERYVGLIYASALRQVRDAHLADDVTQAVFVVLAQKAAKAPGQYLPGWLHKTTRFCAADALKREARRRRYEQQAAAMNTTVMQAADSSPSEIAAELDAAIVRLKPKESTAIVMRYLQNKTSADVAAEIGVSQDAAQKIIARALPKLRRILTGRGLVLSSTAGLSEFMLDISRHSARTHFAIHSSSASLSIAKGAMRIMFRSKVQMIGAVAAITMVIGGGAGIILAHHDGSVRAAESVAASAAPTVAHVGVMAFTSPFLELEGCRIKQAVHLNLTMKPREPAAVVNVSEQETLLVNWTAVADVAGTADHYDGKILATDEAGANGESFQLAVHPPEAKQTNDLVLVPTPEPGEYLVQVDAMDAANKTIARATVPVHVQPLPSTMIQIADIQPDGSMRYAMVLQELNTGNQLLPGGQLINSDIVHLISMADNQGRPISFVTQHVGNHYHYRYKLNNPIPPGEAVLWSSLNTADGLITKLANGTFQYSLNEFPGARTPVRRIELYRLPSGARLIATEPTDLPHRMVDGRMQIFMETTIPPGGGTLVSFRYRLAGP